MDQDLLGHHATNILSNLKAIDDLLEGVDDIVHDIKSKVRNLVRYGYTLDYKEVKANGVRTVFKLVSDWTDYVTQDERTDDEIEDFVPILVMINLWFDLIHDMQDAEKVDEAKRTHGRLLTEFDSEAFHSLYIGGYLDRDMPTLAPSFPMLFRTMLMSTRSGLLWKMRTFLLRGRSRLIRTSTENMDRLTDIKVVKETMMSISSPLALAYMKLIYKVTSRKKPPVQTKNVTVAIPSRYDMRITHEDMHVVLREEVTYKDIEMSVLRDDSSDKYYGKLLFFCSISGFLGPKHHIFNDFFIKDGFCNSNPGLTVINVGFSLAPEKKFPHGLLDVFDTYLWVTSGADKVKEMLGFHPKEVITIGGFIFGVPILLNEVRLLLAQTNLPTSHIIFPKALVAPFPRISPTPRPLPSYVLATYSPNVNVNIMDVAYRAYLPMKHKNQNGDWQLVSNCYDIPLNWSLSEDYELVKNPFNSPLYYERMQDLDSIKLFMVGTEIDPFLDDTVQMAKAWRGPIEFTCLPGLFHAPLFNRHWCEGGKVAHNFVLDMISKALNE